MAKRKAQPDKELTKKQIALSGRQRQQKQRLFIGLAALAGLIVVVALIGVYDNVIARPARPVAIVNGTNIRMDQYQARLRYERFLLDSLTRQVDAQLASVDSSDPANDFMVQYLQQIASQVAQQRAGLARQLVDTLVEEELVRQKAAEVGVAVTDDQINEEIRRRIAQQLGYVTEAQATSIASTAVARTATAASFTPTPTLTTTLTASATEVVTPTEETTPEPTPTLHIITDDEFGKRYAEYLAVLNEQARISEADLREYTRAGLLVQAMRQWFADQTPREAEQVNISHIQAATDEQANLAMERLKKGEDFALVASEVSSNTVTAAQGGELGWFMAGQLASRYNPEMEQAAFSLEPGSYSQPITSTMGWQIIKVNERGVHPLNENQLLTKQAESYSTWLQEAKQGAGVQITWTPDMAPPDPALTSTAR